MIAALQSAEVHKPGEFYAHTPFTLAYDSALNMAILGIKAGRALDDVIKMAVTRFKAKFPDADPEDLQAQEQDIRAAHAERMQRGDEADNSFETRVVKMAAAALVDMLRCPMHFSHRSPAL